MSPATQRVAVYHSNSDVRLEERPVPEIGPGEILVRIAASGICGSDVMEWYRIKKAPLILGHEIAGTVARVGEAVEHLAVGDRVTVAHHVPCGTCRRCLHGHEEMCDTLRTTSFEPGGFCEFVRVPALQTRVGTFRIPDELSMVEGSFSEPLGCVVRGQREAGVQPGLNVAVLGAGLSGLLHVKLARALGAGVIVATDMHPCRLEAAERFGADAALTPDADLAGKIQALTGGPLADVVIVATGAPAAFARAPSLAEPGGTVLCFALPEPGADVPLDLWQIWNKGLTLATTYASPPRDTLTALELIRSKRVTVEDMVSHRLPLEAAGEGFRLTAEGRDCLKVVLEP